MLPRIGMAALLSFLILAIPATATAAASPPNVVLIVIDDLGAMDLGCSGSQYYRTPNIDRLAQQGIQFRQAYAACPVCSPTRAALLTGKYPARLQLTDWLPGRPDRPDQPLLRPRLEQQLASAEVTLAELMQAAGYATGHFGKWHLGGAEHGPTTQGFAVNVAGDHAGSPRSYLAPYRGRDGSFIPGLEQAQEGEYLTDRLTEEAVQFIRAHHTQPFFVYLAHYAVHTPLQAKAAMIDHYRAGPPGQQNNPIYAAMIESVDESVGRIVDTLAELGLQQNTIVWFTSDNGGLSTIEGPHTPATINSPLREGKGFLYEGGIRVPLIVSWPESIAGGRQSDFPTSSIDALPTLVELCGLSDPPEVDGTSLAEHLQGGAPPDRSSLYWHYPHYSNQARQPGGAIRRGRWKMIEFFETGRRELYDVAEDAGEVRNLAEESPQIVAELADQLQRWRKMVGASSMQPNPDYVPHPQDQQGIIVLPARSAEVHGVQLRYEALPHKDTLGYWTRAEDWASWTFQVHTPGSFEVIVLQGCGKDQGGSEVEVTVENQQLRFTVQDTGHFQNFVERTIGQVECRSAGLFQLTVRPQSKPGVAVMDLRQIVLRPVSNE